MDYINERDSSIPSENKVIGYTDGMAIMSVGDSDALYYDEIDFAYVTVGEHLVDAQPKPIELLPKEKQKAIKEVVLWGNS